MNPPREEVMALLGLLEGGRLDAAVAYGERLAAAHPRSTLLLNMLGSINIDLDRRERAMHWFRTALAIEPDNVDTLYNLGITAHELKLKDVAIGAFARLVRSNPGHAEAHTHLLYLQSQVCDWDGLATARDVLPRLGIIGAAAPPFAFLALEDAPERHRIRAERFCAERFPPQPVQPFAPRGPRDRLRVGYVSADLRDHPVAWLMARLFELHDRSRFEIFVYAYGDGAHAGPLRDRIAGSVEHFRDVAALSDADVVTQARRDGLDIAIDLTGHTTRGRTALFAARLAPVQIGYLGYPGTMGAPFIDYIVADRRLIPDGHRRFYSEAPLYLPHCYQAQDDRLPVAETAPSRTELGLPETGFVFCAINAASKITPDLFDIWMRLLGRVEGSVLWLLADNGWAERNLRREAQKRGIDPARLHFAAKVPHADYLARFTRADLFLDSFNYNAGATASNALWAGLPVLTMAGTGYTARMAASLLHAIGLPELVTETPEAYEALALELATDPTKLTDIRAKLAANRSTEPLFDSVLFTQHLEAGYELAWQRHAEGLAPEVIDVPA